MSIEAPQPISHQREALNQRLAADLGAYLTRRETTVKLDAIIEAQSAYLWGHQIECIDSVEQAFQQPAHQQIVDFVNTDRLRHPGQTERTMSSALIRMATATGKTEVAKAIAERERLRDPQARVLFLSHRNNINKQARGEFEDYFGPECTYGTFCGDEKVLEPVDFLFATFQSMKDGRGRFTEDAFDLIIVDEAHHSMAWTYDRTLQYFKPKSRLGMTATPDRMDLLDIRDHFGEEVYDYSMAEGMRQGILCKLDYRILMDDVQLDILTTPDSTDMNFKALNRALFIPRRDEEIVSIMEKHMAELETPRHLVFTASIEHAERMAALMPTSTVLHSKMSKKDREAAMDFFKSGLADTLITVDMLNEGIDLPDVNLISILRSTESETVFLQQIGRGMRRAEGKDSLRVLDFVANYERLGFIRNLIYDASRFDTSTATRTRAKIPSQREPSELARQIEELELNDIAKFSFDEKVVMVMDFAVEQQRRKQVAKQYAKLVRDRRGGVIYLSSLRRTLGHMPNQREIIAAARRLEGPKLSTLLLPFNRDYAGALRATGIEMNQGTPDRETMRQITTYPIHMVAKDIVERHRETKLADVRLFNDPGMDGGWRNNFYDALTTGVSGDGFVYEFDVGIHDGSLYFHRYHPDDPEETEEVYQMVLNEAGPRMVSDYINEDPYMGGMFYYMPDSEVEALHRQLLALRDELEAKGLLKRSWTHDPALLPEKYLAA